MSFAKISSKLILCVLTILFWGVAAGLSYIGFKIFLSFERDGHLINYLHSVLPGFIVMGIAFVMFLIGIIGVCGLFSENRCLLGIFFTVMIVLLGLEIAGVVLLFLYREQVDTFTNDVFDEALEKYGTFNQSKLTQNFDFFQHQFQCCGKINYTDWKNTKWYKETPNRYGEIPQSCCVSYQMNTDSDLFRPSFRNTSNDHYCTGKSVIPNELDNYYPTGCYFRLKQVIKDRFIFIAAIVLGLVLIQFVGLVSTCVLMCCRHKSTQQPPYINIATHDDAHYNL